MLFSLVILKLTHSRSHIMNSGFDRIAKSFSRQYLGCYKDNKTQSMERKFSSEHARNNTVESCTRHCVSHNYLFAGLQVTGRVIFRNDVGYLSSFLLEKQVFQCISYFI